MKYIKLKEKSKEELFDIADQLRYDILIKDKEIEKLNNKIEKLEQENAVLKTLVVNKNKYSYGIR